MQACHDFNDSLAASHKASDLPIWKQIYERAFPNFLAMIDHREDGEHQRAGIDRSVILANSKQILVDEKIRYKAYPDIALEHLSNDRTGALGWVCKPLRCDYIAYAIGPLGICYMLPVIQLQQAWLANGAAWKAKYFSVVAPNRTYNTISTAVPVVELFKEIGKALRIPFDATSKKATA